MAGARKGLTFAVVVLVPADCSGSAQPSASVPTNAAPAASASVIASLPPNPARRALSRHLALATNGVVFLQWTRSGDTHTGTLTQAHAGPGDRAALKHQNGQLTGVLSGSLVTPNFPQGLGPCASWSWDARRGHPDPQLRRAMVHGRD